MLPAMLFGRRPRSPVVLDTSDSPGERSGEAPLLAGLEAMLGEPGENSISFWASDGVSVLGFEPASATREGGTSA